MPRAIEFVEAHDKDLWYRLIEHSLKNEAFLSGLLDHAGVYDVDLARLVAEIPKGMHIPGLRDKVVKIISDYHFQARFPNLPPREVLRPVFAVSFLRANQPRLCVCVCVCGVLATR